MGGKINFGKAILDISGIVFAVLLALWLENWMQESEMIKLTNEISGRIVIEVRENRAELISAIEANQVALGIINNFITATSKDAQKLVGTQFTAANTSDAAWESAKMTNTITMMPLDKIKVLADLYETQHYHVNYNQNFFQNIAELMIDIQYIQYEENRTRALQTYAMSMGISNAIGQQLLAKYNSYLGIDSDKAP